MIEEGADTDHALAHIGGPFQYLEPNVGEESTGGPASLDRDPVRVSVGEKQGHGGSSRPRIGWTCMSFFGKSPLGPDHVCYPASQLSVSVASCAPELVGFSELGNLVAYAALVPAGLLSLH
jgi:hypothetical protein